MERFENPWLCFEPTGSNVLACDRLYVHQCNCCFRRGKLKSRAALKVRTALLPEPVFGHFDAPVVVLLQNPGVDKKRRDHQLHRDPEFRKALAESLTSPRGAPHFHVSWPDTPGQEWWMDLCGPLLHDRRVSADVTAQRLLAVEYFPYHSFEFDHRALRLPSQRFSFQLVEDAMERGGQLSLNNLGHKGFDELLQELIRQ